MIAKPKPGKRLVVVPSDPIAEYERAGYDWLERYFNPAGMFEEVYAVSPREEGERKQFGMTIRGVPAAEFKRAVQALHPDVVRGYGGYWAADLVCRNRLPDVPVVVSVHDSNPRMLYPAVRFADRVICTSNVVAKRVEAIGTDPGRIRLLPNRVDREIFHPVTDATALQAVSDRFPAGKHILHVGRKSNEKNLDTLVRCLRALSREYVCIFVGYGDAEPYRALARETGVADRCFWIETVKNSELPIWYSWCDCMCTPSRWEGFGIVFIEAAACGAAIVTSDIAPMNEYLAAGRSACLVQDYEDPGALARAIRRACEDSEYRARIRSGALVMAESFDREAVDRREMDIYREAMGLGTRPVTFRLQWAWWKARQRLGAAWRSIGKWT